MKRLLILLLFVNGCHFSLIGEKDLEKFAAISKKDTEDAINRAPEPFIESPNVHVTKIVDWEEIIAAALVIGGGIVTRYGINKWKSKSTV